jgi:hypothetical protein
VAGLALWVLTPSADQQAKQGSVEVTQVQERSWTVEVKDLGAADTTDSGRTAANR